MIDLVGYRHQGNGFRTEGPASPNKKFTDVTHGSIERGGHSPI